MHFKKLVPALALTVAITGCTTNPYTGESQTSGPHQAPMSREVVRGNRAEGHEEGFGSGIL